MLKAPPMQTATATIDTLCGRLESATLLEDRRAAILGLRSFAKQFPASVASGSLRELISTLKRDGLGEATSPTSKDGDGHAREGGDVDTIRLVLETLLMLFNPDANSPEAGDEIAFFLADEFSMRQDNVLMLLSLLDSTSPLADYYSRLYSVQLLSAICASRPDRLQECILAAPLGVSRLVGVLDDARDAVRNAGLLLLVDLTSGVNEDLRKIVAFDDVFGKIFALIELEGGLVEAGITAQDCLSLLANLIKGSSSNQAMFRESGCVSQLLQLLTQAFPPQTPEAPFVEQNREKAAWGLLQVLRLFMVAGEASTPQNQTAFFRAGAAQVLIDLGFAPLSLPAPIRASALRAAAALIHSNPPLQEHFAALTVITPSDAEYNAEQIATTQQTNGTRPKSALGNKSSARASADHRRTYVIEALLDLSLLQTQTELLLRDAACSLTQAYLTNHDRIKEHFLQRAIAGHAEQETAANVLITLLHPQSNNASAVIYASCIVQDLVGNDVNAKTTFTSVKEGNESEGEDVLTSVQILGSQLQSSLQSPIDERLATSYASLLTTLLWEFAPGVDDLLSEGSSLMQTLIGIVRTPTDPLITGLAAILLGTVYEFSTKDSPIPRRTLAPLLQQKLGRTKYLDALLQLRRQPAIRDLDLDSELEDGSETLLCRVFVELFALEYSRLRKAVDKDPGVEVLPPSALEAGVDRDVLDDLRQQLQTAREALAQFQQESEKNAQQAERDRMASDKDLQTAKSEVERLQKVNQSVQQGHEHEITKLEEQHNQQRQTMETRHKHALADAKKEADNQTQKSLKEQEAASKQKIQDYEKRVVELGNTIRTESAGLVVARNELEATTTKYNDLIKKEQDLSKQLEDVQRQHATTTKSLEATIARASSAESKLEVTKNDLESRGEELDRLKAQLTELQDELQGREEELRAERAGFADLEKEFEAAKKAAAQAKKDAEKPAAKSKGGKAEKEKLNQLEKELQDTRESEKSAKEELESMLLVMGDIEGARDKYKARVKELGGEVSEEDDDEDEDEDEDEEDGDLD